MRHLRSQPVRILLLVATAFFVALWATANLTARPVDLPSDWDAEQYGVQRAVGGVFLAPKKKLSFNGLQTYSDGDFELELYIRISEYDRFSLSLGSKETCDQFQVVLPIEKRTAFFPPRRITLKSDDTGTLVFEDGKPVKKFKETGKNAACFSIDAISSAVTIEEIKIRRDDQVLYRQPFRTGRTFDSRFQFFLIVSLIVIAVFAVLEKRVAVGSWRLSYDQVAISQFIAVLPFIISSALSLAWEWAAMLVGPSLAWMILSRLVFAYSNARLFDGDSTQAKLVRRLVLVLTGCWLIGYGVFTMWGKSMALMLPPQTLIPFIFILILIWVILIATKGSSALRSYINPIAATVAISAAIFFLGLFLPDSAFRLIWAIAIVNLPLAGICLLYRYSERIRFFNLLVFLCLALLVGSMEGAMRILSLDKSISQVPDRERFEQHDLLYWVPSGFFSEDEKIPGQSYVVEKIDFRSGPAALKKAEGTFRVLVMGGSNVWGDGIKDGSKTFPTVMKKILNQKAKQPIEVINGGVPGYGSMQVLILLKFYLAEYQPDLAVFYFLWNDTNQRFGSHTQRELYEMATSGKYRAAQWAQRHLRRSVLYNGLVDLVASFRREMGGGTDKKLELKKTKLDNEFRKNIEDILAVCRKHKIKPVFVVEYQGADHALGYPYNVGDLEKTMKEVVTSQKVPLLDANEHFYKHGRWQDMVIHDDIMHLSEQGHEKIGRFVAKFLMDQKLVP